MNNSKAIEFADQFHRRRCTGWNTWDTRSVLRHVLLPDGLGISLGFALLDKLVWLNDAHFGVTDAGRTAGTKLTSQDKQLPVGHTIEVRPGPHAYDGSYTRVDLTLRASRFTVETCASGREWIALITPHEPSQWMQILTIRAAVCWGREGVTSRRTENQIVGQVPSGEVSIFTTGTPVIEPNLPADGAYIAVRLDRQVVVSTGIQVSVEDAQRAIKSARESDAAQHAEYGELAEAHEAMQACLGWNLIYEPKYNRALTCVARDWNCWRGGYAVFCWDGFFMAWMIALDDPDLGYSMLAEMFREAVDDQFVPNVAQGSGRRSWDRSQPPVGSVAALAMHLRSPNLDAVAAVYPALMAWNRWWHAHRRNAVGSLSLGSHPARPRVGDPAEAIQPNTAAGAALESGLDNASIYDNAPFDPKSHLMMTEDTGLNALYISDCRCLAKLATDLGQDADARELRERAEQYAERLKHTWSADDGIYSNRRVDTREFPKSSALTSFYPLMCGIASESQVEEIISKHLLNPEKFFGEWMPPVCPRDDANFSQQLYMRGRIWPPTSFLTWLGLKRIGHPARTTLADKSLQVLLNNWQSERVVAENYSGVDGGGGRTSHSHPLYGWGGLLALMSLIEHGYASFPLRD
ncbi:MAG TPA: trehalase family glycosidase [Tepidisphaeraceae bacterium]|nr:trehalase family glycosidase [Tepidisphaeraceae bacterium]